MSIELLNLTNKVDLPLQTACYLCECLLSVDCMIFERLLFAYSPSDFSFLNDASTGHSTQLGNLSSLLLDFLHL